MKKIIPFVLGLVVLAGCGKVENQNILKNDNSSQSNSILSSSSSTSTSNYSSIFSSTNFSENLSSKKSDEIDLKPIDFEPPKKISFDGNNLNLVWSGVTPRGNNYQYTGNNPKIIATIEKNDFTNFANGDKKIIEQQNRELINMMLDNVDGNIWTNINEKYLEAGVAMQGTYGVHCLIKDKSNQLVLISYWVLNDIESPSQEQISQITKAVEAYKGKFCKAILES